MGCEQSRLNIQGQIENNEINSAKTRKKPRNIQLNARFTEKNVTENVVKVSIEKTQTDIQFIEKVIAKHFLLFKLSKLQRRQLVNAMEAYETEINEYVFKQGTQATMFFIILKGKVQIQINEVPVKTMEAGDFFGQLALIYSSPRSASIKVIEKTTFWCLHQHQFLKIQRQMVKNNYKIAKPFVNKLQIFNFLTAKQKDAICYYMNALRYQKSENIFKLGDQATSFYIIIEGLIQVTIPGKPPINLKSGDSFGQNCLKENQVRSGTAVCQQKAQLLAISKEDLKSCIGGQSQQSLLFHNIIKWALRRSEYFSYMNSFDQMKFISLGKIISKDDHEIIVKQGTNDDNLYICLEGKINNFETGVIINESLLKGQKQLVHTQTTLFKQKKGSIFIISSKVLKQIRNQNKKIKNSTKEQVTSSKLNISISRQSSTNFAADFKDFTVLSKLGQGQMGKVLLVENKKNYKKYALKCVEKNRVIKYQMQKFLKAQKQILQLCQFPLIVKLVDSFKDNYFVYFLLKYFEGGDFFDFLTDIGICSQICARFYLGCLLICIQYLHKKNIVYRDLKPQNAAVDQRGYLHMFDMGTAKQLTEESDVGFRTFTLIGTPHYMAPEIMQAKGYSFSVDIWSLGIILYEMVCGTLPFGNNIDDPAKVYQQIQYGQLKFPSKYNDSVGKELINRLLLKHPDKRAVDDFSQIKNMAFFKDFDWKALENQKMIPPVKLKLNTISNNRPQNLINYLEKQKLKMQTPIKCDDLNWDEVY